jgi:hypothetical protein
VRVKWENSKHYSNWTPARCPPLSHVSSSPSVATSSIKEKKKKRLTLAGSSTCVACYILRHFWVLWISWTMFVIHSIMPCMLKAAFLFNTRQDQEHRTKNIFLLNCIIYSSQRLQLAMAVYIRLQCQMITTTVTTPLF